MRMSYDDGVIEMEIRTEPGHILVELRDYGAGFDPDAVPEPDFDSLPECGLGIFIMKAFMDIRYSPGRPNVLTLSKCLAAEPRDSSSLATPSEGEQ